jgi:hypothetical protein
VFIPRKIGENIKAKQEIRIAGLFPPSLSVNNPIIKTVIDEIKPGTIRIATNPSPKRDFQIDST